MNKNILAVMVVLILVASGGFYAAKMTTHAPEPAKEQKSFGALTGPDIPSPYFSYGDVRHWGARTTALVQASSTVCSLQSPAATSTMRMASLRFSLASTAAVSVELARSASPDATTTLIGTKFAVGASATPEIVASTTASTANDPIIFGPSQWFVVKVMGSGNNAGSAPTGVCEALWVEL